MSKCKQRSVKVCSKCDQFVNKTHGKMWFKNWQSRGHVIAGHSACELDTEFHLRKHTGRDEYIGYLKTKEYVLIPPPEGCKLLLEQNIVCQNTNQTS